jgi:WD40 repeat protein
VSGRTIHAHRRLHAVGSFRPPAGWGRPRHLLVLGNTLLAVARRRGQTSGHDGLQQWALLVWAIDAGRGGPAPAALHAFPPGFVPTALAHPPTYVNKILVGGADGSTQLWNFGAGVCLHASSAGADAAAAAGVAGVGAASASTRPAVRVLAPSPALDVVALGFSNGTVALVDVRADAVLAVLADAAGTGAAGAAGAGPVGAPGAAARPPPGGAVTALSFCTAPGLPPLLAVGGSAGCLALWDCEAARLAGVLPAAHAAGAAVTTLHWFAGEPRLMSGGCDNALRQWVLSPGGGTAAALAAGAAPLTLLRSRTGHAAPPALVRWYGPDATRLLCAGGGPRDRSLRLVSAIQDAQSRELSQGRLGAQARRLRVEEADLKLPRIVALDACPVRFFFFFFLSSNTLKSAPTLFSPGRARVRARACVRASPSGGRGCSRGARTAVLRNALPGFFFTAGKKGATFFFFVSQKNLSRPRVGARGGRRPGKTHTTHSRKTTKTKPTQTRERDWANVLTAHAGDPAARTWTVRDGAATGRALLPPPRPGIPPRSAPATAVAVTGCGNFALVGSAAGHVDRYNMQSGLYRGGCTRPGVVEAGGAGENGATTTARPRARRAHDGAITGLAPDAPGRRAVSVGLDGFLRLWDLRTGLPLAEVGLGAPAGRLAAHPGGALVAVALEPCEAVGGGTGAEAGAAAAAGVRVFDIGGSGASDPPRLVRRFFSGTAAGGGPHPVPPPFRATDLAFSGDGRWLLAAGMDGCVRVCDVPAGAVRQAVHLGGPVVSLALSPGGDVLATAHAGRRGVSLWSNQAVFGSAGAAPPAGEAAPPVRVRPPALVSPDGGVLGGGGGEEAGGGAAAARRPGVSFAGGDPRPVGVEDEDDDESGASSSSSSDDDDGSDAEDAASDASSLSDGLDVAAGFESSDDGFASDDGGEEGEWEEGGVEVEGGGADASPATTATAADGAPAPLAPALITTSLLPRSQWRSLAHLDDLRARNKPVAAPTKPADAPFFLPTVPTLAGQPTFAVGGGGGADADAADATTAPGPAAKKPRSAVGTGLAALLRSCAAAPDPPAGTPPPGKWAPVSAWLRASPPSAVDRELAALALEGAADDDTAATDGASPADLSALLAAIAAKVDAGTDWELVQAFLGAVLRAHGAAIGAHPALRTAAAGLAARLRARWERVDDLANAVLAGAAFVGGLPA